MNFGRKQIALLMFFCFSQAEGANPIAVFRGEGEMSFVEFFDDETVCGIPRFGLTHFWKKDDPRQSPKTRSIVAFITAVHLSSDSKEFFVANANKIFVNKIPFETWKIHFEQEQRRAISDFAFSADKKLLVIGMGIRNFPPDGHDEGYLEVLDQVENRTLFKHQFKQVVSTVAVSPDGKRIAVGVEDRSTIIFDATGKKQLEIDAPPIDLQFSSTGRFLCVVNKLPTAAVKIWDFEAGVQHGQIKGDKIGDQTYSVCFSPDGEYLAVCQQFTAPLTKRGIGRLRLYRVKDLSLVETFFDRDLRSFKKPDNAILSASFSKDQTRLLTGNKAGNVKMWDISQVCPKLDRIENLIGE